MSGNGMKGEMKMDLKGSKIELYEEGESENTICFCHNSPTHRMRALL
jgi:hypothetical protein